MKPSKRFALMTLAATMALAGVFIFGIQSRSWSAAAIRSHKGVSKPLIAKQWPSTYEKSLTLDIGSSDMLKPEEAGNKKVASEAPTGFDNLTNGYLGQDLFDKNQSIFEEVETVEEGLGPTYNAQSCKECHQNVVTGGGSQITELRTGRLVRGRFFNSMGGTVIQSRAIHPDIVERAGPKDNLSTFRISLNTLGDGFVECIANDTLLAIRDAQPRGMRGDALMVPVIEAANGIRIGRFGWKSQHASLVSFSADAYLNEMGITSPLFPVENPSNGTPVDDFDLVDDPEDEDGADVTAFADFMRSTKAQSRGPITDEVNSGEKLFNQIGCAVCHVPSIVTAPPGTTINAGAFTVPNALGNKIIRPYSDFLLHDIGTGDGIPVQPIPQYAFTANKMRTAPLWGLRTRNRLMHDGLAFTLQDAIQRHAGQAAGVAHQFDRLPKQDQQKVLAFLGSL